MRPWSAALALVLSSFLVAGAPTKSASNPVNAPCANPDGLPVVTPDEAISTVVETPIGAGVPFVTTVKIQPVDGGDYLVDLMGLEVGSSRTVEVALSWTNDVNDDLTDYDMVVNGIVYEAVTNPEVARRPFAHCQVVSVDEIYTYSGTPLDQLTLDVSVE